MSQTAPGPDLSGLKIQRQDTSRSAASGPGIGRWIGLLVLLAVLAAGGWGARSFLNQAPKTAVTTPTVSRSDLGNEMLNASGYVVSRHQARVGSKALGRVEKMFADEGSHVKKGQLLAQLDQGDLPAQLAQIEANLPQARNALARQKALTARGLTTSSALDEADTKVKSLEAQEGVIRAQEEQLAIRAPFDGTVILRNLELGETISPTSIVQTSNDDRGFVIADLSDLEVEADVNESNIAQLRAGQPARVEVDALPGQGMEARVRMIQPTANRQKATVQAKVSILKPLPQVRPEMNAKVTFLKSGEQALKAQAPPRIYIPTSALVRRGAESGAWSVDAQGALHWLPLEPGAESAGQVEIRRGLTGTESLVVKPAPNLHEGMKIRPTSESAES